MDEIGLSAEDKEFLEKCEEEFKDRFTDKDEEFMKVFNKESSTPPILERWWVPFNSGRRNDRRHNRYNPYQGGNRNQGYSDHRRYNDYPGSHGPHRSRYSNY
ncbi:unnamed protein product [Euphydryas editha]|uniref:Uncharacterized protein n=1 Tax=Euphydryas editha TaxID=104508 RepID=A0AAU9UPM6_EUPED|nr:unnamed protein product [Euphydryas editha]